MRWGRWATCLWPGVAQLWLQGAWGGLALAVAFALLFDAALVVTWIWSQWIPPGARDGLWVLVGVVWLVSAATQFWRQTAGAKPPASPGDTDQYWQGLTAYLQGNWFAAETVFRRLWKDCPHDADAGLMLATLLRHTGRLDEARQTLYQLQRTADCGKWNNEIEHELTLLADEACDANNPDAGTLEEEPRQSEPRQKRVA